MPFFLFTISSLDTTSYNGTLGLDRIGSVNGPFTRSNGLVDDNLIKQVSARTGQLAYWGKLSEQEHIGLKRFNRSIIKSVVEIVWQNQVMKLAAKKKC